MNNRYILFIGSLGVGLILLGAGCGGQTPDATEGSNRVGSVNTSSQINAEKSGAEEGTSTIQDNGTEIVQKPDVVINVTGQNFSFSPASITVKKDQIVQINLTASQGFHDWVIDEFDARTSQINAPGSSSVTFVADKAGEFQFYCSVGQHRQMGMIGTLVVTE
ncbi:MAG TPA: hypothetical protein DCS29_00205 [Candidatus Magasanikbacteria bacterium]|nr:hypothetical protein [Candidatus Magasanikbacteria bacterium]